LDRAKRRFDEARRRATRQQSWKALNIVTAHRAEQEMHDARHRLERLQQLRRHETTVRQELQLRAAQYPEGDETLRGRLGLDVELPEIPIMR